VPRQAADHRPSGADHRLRLRKMEESRRRGRGTGGGGRGGEGEPESEGEGRGSGRGGRAAAETTRRAVAEGGGNELGFVTPSPRNTYIGWPPTVGLVAGRGGLQRLVATGLGCMLLGWVGLNYNHVSRATPIFVSCSCWHCVSRSRPIHDPCIVSCRH
jgi:hypothetical protein